MREKLRLIADVLDASWAGLRWGFVLALLAWAHLRQPYGTAEGLGLIMFVAYTLGERSGRGRKSGR